MLPCVPRPVLAVLFCLSHAIAAAAVRPASIFTDHMVLQRDAAIPIWGTAKPGATVTVRFGDQQPTGLAQADGTWTVVLDPMPASDRPRELILADGHGEPKVIADVVVGDVWLGSGQSNMAWSMKQVLETKDFRPEVVERLQAEVAAADQPLIRFFNRGWKVCTPQSAPTASAVGFYFSLEVLHDQKVPVGFIQAAIGGSRIEPWISEEAFATCEAVNDELPAWKTMENPGERVGFCYGRVIEPWTRFPIKGILWYQGESNVAKGDIPARYAAKMRLLIESWRAAWGRADLPFYWVQLSPVAYTRGNEPDRLPAFQDAQRRVLALPRTGMAMTADVDDGAAGDLHPRNKWDVGRRLWRWAAWDTYGHKEIVPSGPLFQRLAIEGNEAVVFFQHVGPGLKVRDDGSLTGFEVRGEDGIYHPATALIRGTEVVVRSPEVPRPVAVRYNWHETAKRSLFNRDGLPASPFSSEASIHESPTLKGSAP